MPRNNQEMMDRSPLGLLEKVGLIKYLDKLELDNKVVIKGFHYGFMPEKIETDLKKICVAHMFYENGFDEAHSLRVKDCLDLGYDYYVLGHDHTRYPVEGNTTYKLFRIGSLTRGSANENQMIRDEVYILGYDTETDTFKEISIPCASAKEVFKDSVFARKEENKIDTKEVLDNLVFTNNDSIYDVLDKSEQTAEIKAIVEEYLQAAGIYRNSTGDI